MPSAEDHPRIHGEHKKSKSLSPANQGSPPHTRGTLSSCKQIIVNLGITPAYTGNTKRSDQAQTTRKDHPRIHGEHMAV